VSLFIRRFAESDREWAIALTRDNMAAFIEEEWGTPWDEEYERTYRRSFGVEGEILVAEIQGAPVGFVWFSPLADEEEIFVNSIQVLAGRRRGGIGSAMMKSVEERAAELWKNEIVLCVQRCNQGARLFYQALRFAEIGCTRAGFAMRKKLPPPGKTHC
jgi:ribosomal protein S18 acetylase RimI-like enzyme